MALDEYALYERVTALEAVVAELHAQSEGSVALGPCLAKLEQAAADLRALIGPKPLPWWENMAISPELEEAFEEVCRLGAEFRRTGRIPEEDADVMSEQPSGQQCPPEERH